MKQKKKKKIKKEKCANQKKTSRGEKREEVGI